MQISTQVIPKNIGLWLELRGYQDQDRKDRNDLHVVKQILYDMVNSVTHFYLKKCINLFVFYLLICGHPLEFLFAHITIRIGIKYPEKNLSIQKI